MTKEAEIMATCPNCNDTKIATYFSEQRMTHEDRPCHVCRAAPEAGGLRQAMLQKIKFARDEAEKAVKSGNRTDANYFRGLADAWGEVAALSASPQAPAATPRAGLYRVIAVDGGYEPQHSYTAGKVDGVFWYPLNADGFWLEPDAYSYGKITRHVAMTKPEAERALLRARAINHEHIAAFSSAAPQAPAVLDPATVEACAKIVLGFHGSHHRPTEIADAIRALVADRGRG